MQLAAPTFVEPLSVCSRSIRLQGQLPGATVEITGGAGRAVGTWVAGWADERYVLDAAVVLDPGEPLIARQTRGGDQSAWTGIAVAVQDAGPSEPVIVLPVKACSRIVSVDGVAPGAQVTIRNNQNGA